MPLSDEHLAELSEAKRLLENPGLAVKITNFVGKPIEKGFELLPDSWSQRISVATKDALMFAMKGALFIMGMSQDHFTVRRLERQYGTDAVGRVYGRI